MTDPQAHPVDLLPELALGVLGDRDAAPVLAHINSCDSCSTEYREMAKVAALLPLATEEFEPAPELKDALMTRIASEQASPFQAGRIRTPSNVMPIGARWRIGAIAAAAAALLVVAGGLAGFALRGGPDDSELKATSALQAQVVQAAADGTIAVAHGANEAGAEASVVRAPGATAAFVSVSGFPPLPAGKAYQAWYTPDGASFEPSGIFTATGQGTWLGSRNPVEDYAAMGFTIEDKDGALQPSTAPFVIVDLSKAVRMPR